MKQVSIIMAAASIAAASLAQALPAAMPGPSASARVVTSDLDLTSRSGQATLRHRLAIAAAEVCGEASSADPAGRRAIRDCRVAVTDRALAELAARESGGRLAAR
ncbi:hypothetical protein GCM10022280_01080 [Sphingomonas swuensis]|uniref:UrcA family protein n=1 Tax=Sphingomonas swuensis TaxID=977800 RepID=A0ABP7S8Q6_9SPHN